MELYTVCLMFASKYEVKKKIIKKHKNLSSELWLIFFHPSQMFLHELPELVQVPISSVFLSLQLEIGMNGQQIFTLIVDLPSCTYCETIGVVRVAEFNIFIKTSVNLSWSWHLHS